MILTHGIDLDSWYRIGTTESHTYERAECYLYAGFLFNNYSLLRYPLKLTNRIENLLFISFPFPLLFFLPFSILSPEITSPFLEELSGENPFPNPYAWKDTTISCHTFLDRRTTCFLLMCFCLIPGVFHIFLHLLHAWTNMCLSSSGDSWLPFYIIPDYWCFSLCSLAGELSGMDSPDTYACPYLLSLLAPLHRMNTSIRDSWPGNQWDTLQCFSPGVASLYDSV